MSDPESASQSPPLAPPAGSTAPPPPVAAPRRSTLVLEGVAVLLLALNVLASFGKASAEQRGVAYALGAAVAPVVLVLVVLGVARFFKRARTRRSRAVFACWASGIFLVGTVSWRGQEQGQRAMTQGERSGLAFQGETLRHAPLGFSLPRPGPGFDFDATAQAAMNREMGGTPNVAGWILSNGEGSVVIVEAVKGTRPTRGGFAEFATGLRESAAAVGAAILVDTLEWAGATPEYRLVARTQNDRYQKMRCLHSGTSRAVPLIVCVATDAPDSTALDSVRAGLRFEGGVGMGLPVERRP